MITPARESLRQVVSTMAYDTGTVATKIAASGLAIVAAAMWEAATGLVFALMLAAWVLDMASGSIVAGWNQWTFDRFMGGVRKMGLGVIGVGLGVLLDLAAGSAGVETSGATTTAMLIVFIAFGLSAAKNVGTAHPPLGAFLARISARLSPTLEDVEHAHEIRRGNPPAPGRPRGHLNGTEN
jgi:hypothetical protein